VQQQLGDKHGSAARQSNPDVTVVRLRLGLQSVTASATLRADAGSKLAQYGSSSA